MKCRPAILIGQLSFELTRSFVIHIFDIDFQGLLEEFRDFLSMNYVGEIKCHVNVATVLFPMNHKLVDLPDKQTLLFVVRLVGKSQIFLLKIQYSERS